MTVNSLRKPRVLCVDDEPGVLRMLQWLLESRFEVTCTTDTREALARLRSGDFEVVTSDQRMPGMLGTEFLRRARIESPNTMRLMLSSHSDFTEMLDAVNASEVFRFMPKPWDDQQLLDAVGQAAAAARSAPLPASAPMEEPDKNRALEARDDETVLLLDPDPTTEQQMRQLLGPRVPMVWARSTDEANTLIAHHTVAVLLVETQVGTASTLKWLRAIHRSHPQAVSIAMSAERDWASVVRLINEAQIYRFLRKPWGPGHAHRMVHAALAQHRLLLAHPRRTARYAAQRALDDDLECV